MKVILLQDVPHVGQKYDVTDVAPGLAMNKLIPQHLAEVATEGALRAIADKRAEIEAARAREMEVLVGHIDTIEAADVHIAAKANDKGHLFAAVPMETIAEKLSEATGLAIKPELIVLPQPIKEVGGHEITVSLGEKEAKVKVAVEAQ